MLERLAVWYLSRRGRVVLTRTFIGIAFGHCIANRVASDPSYDHWRVVVPKIGQLIALNHSMVDSRVED